jgi:isopenicillin N synthase-like dioxygenase
MAYSASEPFWTGARPAGTNPHRAVNRSGRERYSIPTFFNLDYNAPVACLPRCQSERNPPNRAPVGSGDHLVGWFRSVQKLGRPVAELEQQATARV